MRLLIADMLLSAAGVFVVFLLCFMIKFPDMLKVIGQAVSFIIGIIADDIDI
jgi:hypothetical protein